MKLLLWLVAIDIALSIVNNLKLRKMDRTLSDWEGVLTSIDRETTKISKDLLDIKDQVKKYGLPVEAEENIFKRLEQHAATLRAMGNSDSPATDSPATDSPATDGTGKLSTTGSTDSGLANGSVGANGGQ